MSIQELEIARRVAYELFMTDKLSLEVYSRFTVAAFDKQAELQAERDATPQDQPSQDPQK